MEATLWQGGKKICLEEEEDLVEDLEWDLEECMEWVLAEAGVIPMGSAETSHGFQEDGGLEYMEIYPHGQRCPLKGMECRTMVRGQQCQICMDMEHHHMTQDIEDIPTWDMECIKR